MTCSKTGLVSALALSMAISTPATAQNFRDAQSPQDLPAGLRNQLGQLSTQCAASAGALPDLPAGLDCDTIVRLARMQDKAAGQDGAQQNGASAGTAASADTATPQQATPAPAPAETAQARPDPAPANPAAPAKPQPGAARADDNPATAPGAQAQAGGQGAAAPQDDNPAAAPATQGTAQADGGPQPESPAAAPAADTDGQAAAEATPDAAAAAPATPAKPQPGVTRADDNPATAPTTPDSGQAAASDPAPQPVEDTPPADTAEADAAPQTEAEAQAQADAVAQRDQGAAAAAAAAEGDAQADTAEVVEQTISQGDVRQSSEDFDTNVDRSGARVEAEEDGDDNTLRNAALLGLGALALSQILGDDAEVVSNSGDRVVVREGDRLRVLRNDDVLLRRPGADVQTYRYQDGSTRNVVSYDDGTQVETIRAADGRVLRRTRILNDGTRVVLFDDTRQEEQVVVNELPQTDDRRQVRFEEVDSQTLAEALRAQEARGIDRAFTLNQVRNIDRVRQLVPEISVDTINFRTASAAIQPQEAEELAALGNAMRRMIEENPREVFLIEGHTDAVGDAAYNLALSDRRAESVALALTEYFDVPPANMVLQGYGESDLLVPTTQAERANRRAAVRRITPLLRQTASR